MPREVVYRRLTPGNAGMLEGADAFDNPVDPEQLRAFAHSRESELVFATVGAEVIGFASGTVLLHPDKPPMLFVNEVGVNEGARRRGVGRELLGRLIDIARARGCRGVWLATEADNRAARGLYRKLDARETEGIVVYDWDGAMDD